jgi:hypothetical protein
MLGWAGTGARIEQGPPDMNDKEHQAPPIFTSVLLCALCGNNQCNRAFPPLVFLRAFVVKSFVNPVNPVKKIVIEQTSVSSMNDG